MDRESTRATDGGRNLAMTPPAFAPTTFGGAVRQWRRVRDLSQQELAAKVGRSRTWISAVERGRIVPSLMWAVSIARALGLDLSELLDTTTGEST